MFVSTVRLPPGEIVPERMVEERARSRLGVLVRAADVDRFLVLADVPQLKHCGSATCELKRGRDEAHPVACDDEELVVRPQRRLGRIGRADHKLLHGRVPKRARDSEDSCTFTLSIGPNSSLGQGRTVDAVVHDEPTGVSDALRLLRVRALVVVRESYCSPSAAVTAGQRPVIAAQRRDSREHGARVAGVGGVERAFRSLLHVRGTADFDDRCARLLWFCFPRVAR